MLFTKDIVLAEEMSVVVNAKLELWWQILESRGFRLNRFKTEYV